MKLREYLELPQAAGFPEFASRLKRFGEMTAKETIFGKQGALITGEDEGAFNELFQMESRASRNAPAATGRFPVVMYHPGAGGSFDENAILFEFLASHGYVVISSAYQTNTIHVSNNVDGPARSIRDMQFLMQAVSTLPYVDINRIAGIGHSAGAQTLMQWIGEADCPLAALVSLDSTLEYTPLDFPGHKELRQSLANMETPTIPVMLFASTERNPEFTRFDKYLRRAARYEVMVSHLRHNEYISQGVMRAALTDRKTAAQKSAAASMRNSYDQVCFTIKHFLDFVLNSNKEAGAALNAPPPPSLKVRFRAPR